MQELSLCELFISVLRHHIFCLCRLSDTAKTEQFWQTFICFNLLAEKKLILQFKGDGNPDNSYVLYERYL